MKRLVNQIHKHIMYTSYAGGFMHVLPNFPASLWLSLRIWISLQRRAGISQQIFVTHLPIVVLWFKVSVPHFVVKLHHHGENNVRRDKTSAGKSLSSSGRRRDETVVFSQLETHCLTCVPEPNRSGSRRISHAAWLLLQWGGSFFRKWSNMWPRDLSQQISGLECFDLVRCFQDNTNPSVVVKQREPQFYTSRCCAKKMLLKKLGKMLCWNFLGAQVSQDFFCPGSIFSSAPRIIWRRTQSAQQWLKLVEVDAKMQNSCGINGLGKRLC